MLTTQQPVQVLARGNPDFETILRTPPSQTALVTSEENYCPDCIDCDINCEECDPDH